MKRNYIIIVMLLVVFASYANKMPIIQLGVEKGLSNEYVVDITQDKDGFLWFATEDGLNKFDGTNFVKYFKHTNSLSGNQLNSIFADPLEPIIWIATQRDGLSAFNYEKNTLKVFVHDSINAVSLITNDVTSLIPSSNGNLWLSTYYRGVEYFDKSTQTFRHYNTKTLKNMASDKVWCLLDDGNDHLYIGHVDHGLSVLSVKTNQIKNYRWDANDKESIPGDDVKCVYKDRSDNIWVGTNNGLALFNAETGRFIKLDDTPGNILKSSVFDILQTVDNKLWIATELNGVIVIDLLPRLSTNRDSLHIVHYSVGYNKYSLSGVSVRSIFQDSFKNMWLGIYGGGVNFIGHSQPLFDAYSFSPIPDEYHNLNNRVALSTCLDDDGRLWVGTDGSGINVLDKGKRVAIYNKQNSAIGNNTIQAEYNDSNGNLWFGAFWGGVSFYNYKEKRFYQIALNGTTTRDIRCFFEDSEKQMWIGTDDGIFLLNVDTHKIINHFTIKNYPLPENSVRSIVQDSKKRIWIGSFGQGVAVLSKEMKLLEKFSELEKGFFSNAINYIFKDSQERMWVATGDGLICFPNPDSFQHITYDRKDGLYNTFIRAITEDANGNLWFSTNAGISCLLEKSKKIRNYNYFDKTPMGSFTNNVVKDKSGIIYFGSNSGVRFFDPISVLSYRPVPPVVVSEITIFETKKSEIHKTSLKNNVELNYRQNSFNVKFAIQDFSLSNHVDFAYMLEGLDETWHTTVDNNVMYQNIPPGKYKFHVRAQIRNQEWTDDVTTIPITIIPPLWLRWWAKILYVAIFLAVFVFLLWLYKKRVQIQSTYDMEKKNFEQEQELNNERLRFYTNITHELRTPLTLILGPLEDLQKDNQLTVKQNHKISAVRQSALRLLNLINQILEFRKTETQNRKLCVSKSNLATLVKEIALKYKELNTKSSIKFIINIEDDSLLLYFDKEIITIILDNLISNAIKYTDRGQITISLYTEVRNDISYTEIKVEDSGYGISPEEQTRIFDRYYQVKNSNQASGTGIGLALVKSLVALHEGTIRVESELYKGSSFVFSLLTHNIYTNALHKNDTEEKELQQENEDHNDEQFGERKPILLIVEDNADISNYIFESFIDSFDVLIAKEGAEGYKAAVSHIPDIIVSDIMMPGMDGIAFLKKVKEDLRTSHIPIILLTAKDTLEDKEKGYVYGADSYMTKPFSSSLLRSRIQNLLENRKKMAELFSKNMNIVDKSTQFKESLNKLDNDFIQQLTQLIEDNLESEAVNITYLANKLSMSNSTLFRKTKALTGISTNEFIRKIKMKNAEQLLLSGKYNISEIAYKVGMNSPVYFRQCFKEAYGITPSEYLKNLEKRNG